MTKADKEKFAEIMYGLAENFGDQLSAAGLRLRFTALEQFSIEEVHQAAMSLAATRKFTKMPTVADFLEHLGGGSVDDKGHVEAAKVWKALTDVGSYQDVAFDDPVTQAVIVNCFGGWQRLCGEMLVDQQKWFIKDFCKHYGAYARQGVKHYGALPGRFGEKTCLIGDREKAQQILQLGEGEGNANRKLISVLNDQKEVGANNKKVANRKDLPDSAGDLL